jgi:hypothetical protein
VISAKQIMDLSVNLAKIYGIVGTAALRSFSSSPRLVLLGINPTQPDPKKNQIRSKQIRIMIRSEV